MIHFCALGFYVCRSEELKTFDAQCILHFWSLIIFTRFTGDIQILAMYIAEECAI